ncbi:MAG: T9SS type A sorting domain-containing protein [Bacteroidota bacterium]
MDIQRLLLLIFSLVGVYSARGQNASQLIYMDQGELVYVPFAMLGQSNEVNTIPDFSYAGYMGGGVSLPTDIPIGAIVTPEEGDDAGRIQAAIDLVEALEPDNNGFRGVVLLKAGHYGLENTLSIRASGVVLRGEGQGLNGTVLHSNLRVNHNVISIVGSGGTTKDAASEQAITTDYVPVGSYAFEISDASGLEVGEKIVVTRTPNQVWIDELGMDQETLCAGDSDCFGWTPSSYTIEHERVIMAISGNTISIDIPIVDVMEEHYGGGVVTRVSSTRRISHCGVENMRIQSFYDSSTDESHAWTAVRLRNTENCWVKQVTGQYLAYSTVNIDGANFITVQDCAYIDPKSRVTGGRRYSFAIQDGVGNLFQRCYAKDGRHDFVTGSRVTGPNVFLDGLAASAESDIGPHHRWATGTLFDNIRAGSTRVWNRGNSGTGHGWSGAQTMFWNIASYNGEFRVDSPRGAINWGIGCIGTNQTGDGYWESWGTTVQPRSLYLQQLTDRLGVGAVENTVIPEQQSGEIYDLLTAWSGNGDFSDGGFRGEVPHVSFINPTSAIDVSTWLGGDIQVDAYDNDGTIENVKLLINGEPVGTDTEAPYIFTDLTTTIQNLSHDTHYLQVIATDNDGNTSFNRIAIFGGDPPPADDDEEEEENEYSQTRVYPNPVQNRALTIEMEKIGSYTVQIFDLYGREVDHFTFEGVDYEYSSENIAKGVYVLEIREIEEIRFKSKLVIQ